MDGLLGALGGSIVEAIATILIGMFLLGIPLALFEGLFGRGASRGKDGLYREDLSAQELYERRLRNSRRR